MRRRTLLIPLVILAAAAAAAPVQADRRAPVRLVDPAVVEIDWPATAGGRERPVVEFDHALHVDALETEDCVTCHVVGDDGFDPSLAATVGIEDGGALMDAFHDSCTGCHVSRSGAGKTSGPVTCGECHTRLEPGVSLRVDPVFDLSLHARHAQAYPDDCGRCHHVLDETSEKLVYRENTEEACRACHGEVAVDGSPALGEAVHRECVGCHLERAERAEDTGPTRCVGCHDEARLDAIEPLDEVPRLTRGQPDLAWVEGIAPGFETVPFNHELHEATIRTCSACHHQRIRACVDCHSLRPGAEGGGVNLERAHHERGSTLSCVGCHLEAAGVGDCAGCHVGTTVAADSEADCAVCHRGPSRPSAGDEPPPPDGWVTPVELAALPRASDDLPDEVTIEILADVYEPSTFPHLKIIRRFDDGIRSSSLARRFHGATDAMCAGCHHHSPVGQRPPPCSSCHGDADAASTDRPSLKVAYHRQCVSCHQRLELKVGCTDCHAAKEGTS
jgi:hypothetical protein